MRVVCAVLSVTHINGYFSELDIIVTSAFTLAELSTLKGSLSLDQIEQRIATLQTEVRIGVQLSLQMRV